ncbi:MAG: hypothetical protein B7X86_07505 [Sphingobacteriales bacterium 17-39-43]|uniref:phosphoribosyltransferase-like protein n=1 Tax=Daejeonella sp. TaxID=2805397 RepID=UPI000BCEA85C|nr:hypothetical protein [Daejeonella sp.]OZA24883.1 MAG: hypothetical protein B7X86_07505 [Sphingobacteriales bacterium 17-39-43]HQT22944.1 hypothetical protein [Daejeonella sp.]HQT57076.1 hypothetical protein [Daejeonella sp.]
MRSGLAEKLLVKTMDWPPDVISRQRPLLQALANFKYDEYQQFSPGIRFIESLVKWLTQFEELEERKTAYNFIINHLVFISNDQMAHLVNITYADKINPIVIDKTSRAIKINPFWVRKIVKSAHYRVILRRSLFIGLSDGSRIDQLRRSFSRISNEQVLATYTISDDKVNDMLEELKKSGVKSKFNTVFLIDDFTASGTSYFRKSGENWGGKIYKFINSVFILKSEISNLMQEGEILDIHIIFYIATVDAMDKLAINIKEFQAENPECNFQFSIEAIQVIGSEIKTQILEDTLFVDLIRKYYDDDINDSHYKMGKHDEPYLGFNECCLPLVLNHNTPNNSLPILWFPDDKKYKGLFPRVTRHKDE